MKTIGHRYDSPIGKTCCCADVFSTHLPKEFSMSLINTQVQPFKAKAFHNGQFIDVTEASLTGKWSVLIFMPAAFTSVSYTHLSCRRAI